MHIHINKAVHHNVIYNSGSGEKEPQLPMRRECIYSHTCKNLDWKEIYQHANEQWLSLDYKITSELNV